MKSFFMYKVVCPGCGKVRLWDDLDDVPKSCWECETTNNEPTKTEVTE